MQLSSVSHLGCYVSRLQILSLHRGEGACTAVCLTSRDVLKAAWKGINVSVHYLVPILLPQNGSRQPDGVRRNLSGSLCSPLPNPACKLLSRAAHPFAHCKLQPGALSSKQKPARETGREKNILNPLNLATNRVAGDGDGHWWGTLAYIYHPDRFLGDLPVHLSLELRV